jgi:uncharacterized protein (DUF1778 family)
MKVERLYLRIEPNRKELLKRVAKREGVTLTQCIDNAIDEYLNKKSK